MPPHIWLYMNHSFWCFFLNVKISKTGGSSEGDGGVPERILKSPNCFHRCCQTKVNKWQSPIILTLQMIVFISLHEEPHKSPFLSVVFCTRPAHVQLTPLSYRKCGLSSLSASCNGLEPAQVLTASTGLVRQESCDKMLEAWLCACQNLTSTFTPWILLPSAVKNLTVPAGKENITSNYNAFSQQK